MANRAWHSSLGQPRDRNVSPASPAAATSSGGGRSLGRPWVATSSTTSSVRREARGGRPPAAAEDRNVTACVDTVAAEISGGPQPGVAEDRNAPHRPAAGVAAEWRSRLRAAVDHNFSRPRASTRALACGGHPRGRPGIATTREIPLLAPGHRDGRPPNWPRVTTSSTPGWTPSSRSPFGAALDRNYRELLAAAPENAVAVVPRGGRGSQPPEPVRHAHAGRRVAVAPCGRPWIPTGLLGGLGRIHPWRLPLGAAVDRTQDLSVAANPRRLVAVAPRGGRGPQRHGLEPEVRNRAWRSLSRAAEDRSMPGTWAKYGVDGWRPSNWTP